MRVDIIAPTAGNRALEIKTIIEQDFHRDDDLGVPKEPLVIRTSAPDLWRPEYVDDTHAVVADLYEPHPALAADIKRAVGLGKAALAFIPSRADIGEYFGNFALPELESNVVRLLPTTYHLSPDPGRSVHELVVRRRRDDGVREQQILSWFRSNSRLYTWKQQSPSR